MAEPDRGVLLNYPEKVVSPNDFRNLAELEQTLLAFIDRYNTTARPFNWKFTAAALTNVTVSATHRRQGLLRQMITAALAAAAERGEHLGILIASEYPIYGRFGYGPAAEAANYIIDSGNARFRQPSIGTVESVSATTSPVSRSICG